MPYIWSQEQGEKETEKEEEQTARELDRDVKEEGRREVDGSSLREGKVTFPHEEVRYGSKAYKKQYSFEHNEKAQMILIMIGS